MFGKAARMTADRIKTFRSKEIKVVSYDPTQSWVVTLKSGKYTVNLSIDLQPMDEALRLTFSGDAIATDGKCLSRIMKVLWNDELPEYDESDELRRQLHKKLEPMGGFARGEGDTPLGAPVRMEREPIFFRDMAQYVCGMSNEVVVITKKTYDIDD